MLSVERVDHIILININLVINVHILFDELNKLLHFLTEQNVNLVGKLGAQYLDPFFTRAPVRLPLALRAVVNSARTARLIKLISASVRRPHSTSRRIRLLVNLVSTAPFMGNCSQSLGCG